MKLFSRSEENNVVKLQIECDAEEEKKIIALIYGLQAPTEEPVTIKKKKKYSTKNWTPQRRAEAAERMRKMRTKKGPQKDKPWKYNKRLKYAKDNTDNILDEKELMSIRDDMED